MEKMIDGTLMSSAMQKQASFGYQASDFEHVTRLFGGSYYDILKEYQMDRGFTTLHEVLLGIDCTKGSLNDYLISLGQVTLPSDVIDAPDACGRTALAWAVEYGWPEVVKPLLSFGSDPRQSRPTIHGKSPLLHIVIAGPASQGSDSKSIEVVKLLLRAGVDVNDVDHEGWTALHVAASWNLYDVILELVKFGAPTLDWDALTDDNQSALELSLGAGPNEKVQQLLQTHTIDEEDLSQGVVGLNKSLWDSNGVISEVHDGDVDDLEERFYDALELS